MKYTAFNDSELMQQFSGDKEILLDMICIFQHGLEGLLRPIRESVLREDAGQLMLNAHTFKGVMGNFYAVEAKLLACKLEQRGQQAIFSDTLILLNKLENELQIFLFELITFKRNLITKA